MTIKTLISTARAIPLAIGVLMLAACDTKQGAQQADNAYQQALAIDDLAAQRVALLALVRAREDVSDYWIRLGQVELELGEYRDAYEHFSRAHELDRTAVLPLSMMTELAVVNGRLDFAEDHLKELAVIAPTDRAVLVARGFEALRNADYVAAQANVASLLAQSPSDSIANVLQARILVAQKRIAEAVQGHSEQRLRSPSDRAMLQSLGALHHYIGDWKKAAAVNSRAWELSQNKSNLALRAVSDALRANEVPFARALSGRVLEASRTPEEAEALLSIWARHALDAGSGNEPPSLPLRATSPIKVEFAHYLNRMGRPERALAMLGMDASSLGEAQDAHSKAVIAESLFLLGRHETAERLVDEALRIEPDQQVGLATRARLRSLAGDHVQAIADGQRLVASYGKSVENRLLLVDLYRKSGDLRGADRALWDGYRDFPADELLYKEVRRGLVSRGDKVGLEQLDRNFEAERYSELVRELA
jgi:tetratricopeptide (TPR) repeat protein